jgi:hypothetical protein
MGAKRANLAVFVTLQRRVLSEHKLTALLCFS